MSRIRLSRTTEPRIGKPHRRDPLEKITFRNRTRVDGLITNRHTIRFIPSQWEIFPPRFEERERERESFVVIENFVKRTRGNAIVRPIVPSRASIFITNSRARALIISIKRFVTTKGHRADAPREDHRCRRHYHRPYPFPWPFSFIVHRLLSPRPWSIDSIAGVRGKSAAVKRGETYGRRVGIARVDSRQWRSFHFTHPFGIHTKGSPISDLRNRETAPD